MSFVLRTVARTVKQISGSDSQNGKCLQFGRVTYFHSVGFWLNQCSEKKEEEMNSKIVTIKHKCLLHTEYVALLTRS